MRVHPKTDDELARERCVSDGTYDFEVIKAEETTSKKGNEMIALVLRVFREDGSTVQVKDWLLDAIAYKVKHFAQTVGRLEQYQSGQMAAEDLIGCGGRVKIVIQDDATYGPQNKVKDYDVESARTAKDNDKTSQSFAGEVDDADDIPF